MKSFFVRIFLTIIMTILLTTLIGFIVQDSFFKVLQRQENESIDNHLRNVRIYIVNFEVPISRYLERNDLELHRYTSSPSNQSIQHFAQGVSYTDLDLSNKIKSYDDAIKQCKLISRMDNKVRVESFSRINGEYIVQTFCDENNIVYSLVSPYTQYQVIFNVLQRSILIVLVVSLLISIVVASSLARYFNTQIQKMQIVTSNLIKMDFTQRIPSINTSELQDLANNINNLGAQLEFTINKLKDNVLEEQNAKVKQAQMFASMSHELKTPITILKGTLEGIKDQIGPYKNPLNYTDDMIEEVNNMENIVMNLLDYARFSKNVSTLNFTAISLRELINKEVSRLKYLIDEKMIDLETNLVDDIVYVDVPSIKVALKNILENAIFYSQVGVKIEIIATSFNKHVLVQVINHGTNMNQDSTSVVFEPFYREEESRLKYKNGTGLGLTIVKQILEQHHSTFSLYNINDDDEYAVCFEFTLSNKDLASKKSTK
ncbi:MAG: ATP-binding protein [Bacilli bacterium]